MSRIWMTPEPDFGPLPEGEKPPKFVVIDEVDGGFSAASLEDIRELERRMTQSMGIPARLLDGKHPGEPFPSRG